MSLLDNIRQGSYRGISFDTFKMDRTEKKKYTEHQFANSNRRYIEERGINEPDFSVTMSIFGSDETYLERRDALRNALRTKGEGLLVLPLEGEYNVKCVDFSDSQDILENLGRCDFTASFKVVSKNESSGNPVAVKNAKISLANSVKSLRNTVANMVNKSMVISNATSYAKSLNKLNTFVGNMTTIANNAGNSSFSNVLKNFSSSVPNFLGGNIGILGSAISTLFYTFESAYDTANLLFSSSETLFAYGDTDISVSPNTPQRVEQIKNQQALNTQIKVSALGTASNGFANIDFANEEDLRIAEEKIETQIESILNSDALNNPEIEGIEDVKYQLKQLQVDFADVVAEKEAITPKIKEVAVRKKSVSMIAYQYYDSIDNADALTELNNISNPKQVTGNIRIFTNVG